MGFWFESLIRVTSEIGKYFFSCLYWIVFLLTNWTNVLLFSYKGNLTHEKHEFSEQYIILQRHLLKLISLCLQMLNYPENGLTDYALVRIAR
jgi:hypothetical protein